MDKSARVECCRGVIGSTRRRCFRSARDSSRQGFDGLKSGRGENLQDWANLLCESDGLLALRLGHLAPDHFGILLERCVFGIFA